MRKKGMALLAASTALAAALVCGCAPASAPPTEPAVELPYDSSRLEDGTLRLFYGDEGSTVLCGGTVLYRGDPTDTVALLEDEVTGTVDYYLVSCNRVEDGTRTSLVYDRTGALVYDCGVQSVADLADGRLILRDYVGYDYELARNYDYRIVDLATGTVTPLTEEANNWCTDGAGHFLAVRQTAAAAEQPDAEGDTDEAWTSYNQVCYRSTTIVYDSALREMARFEHCRGMQAYGWFSEDPKGWVYLECALSDEQEGTLRNKLYCPATGEMIDDYVSFCGRGVVCTGTEEAGYQVRRLADGAILGEYDRPCELYLPELALVWRPASSHGNYGYYAVYADGSAEQQVRSNYSNNTVALLFEDGELRLYDLLQPDEPLYRTQVEQPEGTYSVSIDVAEGGVSVLFYDNEYNTLRTQFYSPEGLLADVDGSEYDSFYYLTESENGPVFAVGRDGPGGATLVDVIDAQGNVLCSGLAYAYQTYGSGPEGCFRARKGFQEGWMAADGTWVYCDSIFRTLYAEDGTGYIW